MAQTGYTPISIYYSSTAAAAPTAGNLVAGELAINTADGKLFYKDSSGVVQTLATKATGSIGGSNTQVQYNNNGVLGGSANFVFDGTNVGIGTTPSGAKLDISGSGAVNLKITSTSSNAQLILNSSGTNVSYINYGQTGANPLAFYDSNAAAERMRILSTGVVNIGTSTASNGSSVKLMLNGGASGGASTGLSMCYAGGTFGGGGIFSLTQGGGLQFYTFTGNVGSEAYTERMVIDSSGNVGIGSTSPNIGGLTRALTINTPVAGNYGGYELANAGTLNFRVATNNANAFCGTQTAIPLIFDTNGTERMRIDSSGNLLVGTTNSSDSAGSGCKIINLSAGVGPSVALVGSASTNGAGTGFEMYSTGAAAYRFYVGYGGTIFATSTSITGISDQRLKENIVDLPDGLNAVMALKPRKFDWKEGKGKGIKGDRGFIAQEFETVFPDMIEEWKDPAPEGEEPYKAVNANLIPTLVKAIQELKAEVDSLKQQLGK
jgi:hypothetical protein